MPLTSAQKQARYRERHLGKDGTKIALHLFVEATTRAKLKRLSRHKDRTITALIEDLVAGAERRVTAPLSGKALKTYLDGE
jgi:hypothetical protein